MKRRIAAQINHCNTTEMNKNGGFARPEALLRCVYTGSRMEKFKKLSEILYNCVIKFY